MNRINMRLIAVFTAVGLFVCAGGARLHAQQREAGIVLAGKLYDRVTGRPVDAALVAVVELKIKTRSAADGSYSLTVPAPGDYTVVVVSALYTTARAKLHIERAATRDFALAPVSMQKGLTVVGFRDVQKIARYTMTSRQMKDVPASFGDSVSALTSLPGVIRTSGFFGPLVIRGADSITNRYYIDDIPVYNPQHFGGVHSVISNDLMSEVDLYASAFPARFGGAMSAVININTLDEVDMFGGVAEMGLISSNFLLKAPIELAASDGGGPTERKGYWIASGRYSYYSLFIPLIYRLMTGDSIGSVPEYWDYQVKGKYAFNKKHSVTLLVMGSRDYINFINESTPPDEMDPLLANFKFKNDLITNSAGLRYTYHPSERSRNILLGYASLNDSLNYINVDNAAPALKDINIVSKPYMYGLKDTITFEWWKNAAELRAGAEFVLYNFRTEGNTITLSESVSGIPDFGDPDLFKVIRLGETTNNVTLGGYVENKFTFGRFTLVPGVRAEYLNRSGDAVVDPRGMASYEFPTQTTVSVAGGWYSNFVQANPYLFNYVPSIASRGEYGPERAVHRAVAVEQKLTLCTLKVEGFYNTFFDLLENDPVYNADGDVILEGHNTGRQKAYGAEFMLRIDREERRDGLFGWINYTYTQSKRKTGVSPAVDPWYNRYLNFNQEQKHALKIVAGYSFGRHTLSSRFQLYSSFPYTPIMGGKLSPGPGDPGYDPANQRYVPTYDGAVRNSKHFPLDHRFDVRYSYKTDYEWGYVSWYIEVINVYNQRPIDQETWNYRKPYGPGNPRMKKAEGIAMIPNFGVEVKF